MEEKIKLLCEDVQKTFGKETKVKEVKTKEVQAKEVNTLPV